MSVQYEPEEKARAISLGMLHGAQKAAAMMGPHGPSRRQISRWLAGQQIESPLVEAVVLESREAVVDLFWGILSEGAAVMRKRIHDPKTRAGEIAALLRVAGEQYALLSGGPTSRTESTVLSAEVLALPDAAFRGASELYALVLGSTDEELTALIEKHGLRSVMDGEAMLAELGENDA